MGICGTAMGNAALLLKEQGHEVLGADSGVYPPMSDVLEDAGIEIFDGFDSKRLANLNVDQVVVGNAMSRGNPEIEWVLDQSDVPFVSLPQLFHETVLPGRHSIVVSGTHGKTTTSTIAAFLLNHAGLEPGWLIGGVPRDLPKGAILGKGKPFIIEGDEYDSAFFDKRSKFIHYRPKIAILNNLEFDHADIFRDLEDVKRTFRHFLRIVPASGYALVNGDDENLLDLLPAPWTQVLRVGVGAENDLQIRNFVEREEGAQFELHWKGEFWAEVKWRLHGLFNARNAAMASLAVALESGVEPRHFDLSALSGFRGVRRRQDVLFESTEVTVVEDFAHHPTAVKGALEALRAAYPRRELIVCFEPRSNTAASSIFESAFTEALALADFVYLGAVHRAERMEESARLNTARIARQIGSQEGKRAEAFTKNADLEKALARSPSIGPRLIIFFTNGSFDGVPQRVSKSFK